MSYRNPKAAPINTGAAVYQGIQKLAGDVYTFAKEEQTRKGELIAESLAAQQARDGAVGNAIGGLGAVASSVGGLVEENRAKKATLKVKDPTAWRG